MQYSPLSFILIEEAWEVYHLFPEQHRLLIVRSKIFRYQIQITYWHNNNQSKV